LLASPGEKITFNLGIDTDDDITCGDGSTIPSNSQYRIGYIIAEGSEFVTMKGLSTDGSVELPIPNTDTYVITAEQFGPAQKIFLYLSSDWDGSQIEIRLIYEDLADVNDCTTLDCNRRDILVIRRFFINENSICPEVVTPNYTLNTDYGFGHTVTYTAMSEPVPTYANTYIKETLFDISPNFVFSDLDNTWLESQNLPSSVTLPEDEVLLLNYFINGPFILGGGFNVNNTHEIFDTYTPKQLVYSSSPSNDLGYTITQKYTCNTTIENILYSHTIKIYDGDPTDLRIQFSN